MSSSTSPSPATPQLSLPPPPWIVGHRGAAGSALENTLDAIARGIDESVDMLELDIQLSRDGSPVVFHDWDLRRLAGRSDIIERTDAKILTRIDLPGLEAPLVHRIPTLEQAIGAVPRELPINLELKRRFHDPDRFVAALLPVLQEPRPLLVSSFDWKLLAEIRRRRPEAALAPLGRWKADELLACAEELAAFSVHAHRELAAQLVARSRRPVLAYTVNDPEDAAGLFAAGVAGVFSDSPGRLRSAALPTETTDARRGD